MGGGFSKDEEGGICPWLESWPREGKGRYESSQTICSKKEVGCQQRLDEIFMSEPPSIASFSNTKPSTMPPRLRGTLVPQCSSCLRRCLDASFESSLRPIRQQVRGAKVKTAPWHQPNSNVVVQLNVFVDSWGKKGKSFEQLIDAINSKLTNSKAPMSPLPLDSCATSGFLANGPVM